MTSLLLVCFDTLDTFGKEPEQLKNIQKLFEMMLGDYEIGKVERAFIAYMRRGTAMPKPADIINILDPEEPELSKEMYISLQKKDPEYRTSEEWAFIRKYESQKMGDVGNETRNDVIRDNQRLRVKEKSLVAEIMKLKEENKALEEMNHVLSQ